MEHPPQKTIFKTNLFSFLNKMFTKKNNTQDIDNILLSTIKHYRDASNNINDISEYYLFSNIIALRGKKAKDVMIPRADILALSISSKLDYVIKESQNKGYSRLPIYKDNLDNVIGFLHVKDLIPIIANNSPFEIKDIIRPIIFVSPYMKILDLLYEMKTKKLQLAIVVDEFGGVDGLVTMEDVMEEIVGEITDEHDKNIAFIINKISNFKIEIDARISIEDLEKSIGSFATTEEKEEFETLGGLVAFIAGYIPSVNEIITHSSGVEFLIKSADALKVKKIIVDFGKLKNVKK